MDSINKQGRMNKTPSRGLISSNTAERLFLKTHEKMKQIPSHNNRQPKGIKTEKSIFFLLKKNQIKNEIMVSENKHIRTVIRTSKM